MPASTKLSPLLFIPAVIWTVLVYILLTLPGKDFDDSPLMGIPYFDKVVHACLFGSLMFWYSLPFSKRMAPSSSKLLGIAAAVSLYGILMEFVHKYFTADRNFDFWAMLADTAGAFLSYLCMRFIFFHVQKRALRKTTLNDTL